MNVIGSATDLLYGVGGARSRFELLNPEEPVLLSAACKARHSVGSNLGNGWAFSRRGALLVTDRRLVCGDWELPFLEVEQLTYNPFHGVFSEGVVLTARMQDGKSYQFGLGKSEEWVKSLPVEVEAGERFGRSLAVTWTLRVAVVVLLAQEFF